MPKTDENNQSLIKVLLIEDDFYISQLYEDAFSLEPAYKLYKISEIDTPNDAIEQIREIKPDIILLDLVLPLKSGKGVYVLDKELGFEILERLKKDKELSEIPIIVVSNLGGFLEKERAKIDGAETYLVKSEIFPYQIISTIDKVLSNKK